MRHKKAARVFTRQKLVWPLGLIALAVSADIPAHADVNASCPAPAEITIVDGEAVLPEFPRIVKVGEHSVAYTLYNKTNDKTRLDPFTVILDVKTTIFLSSLGMIVDGKPKEPETIAPNRLGQYMEISYAFVPKLSHDRIEDVSSISVVKKPPNARSTVRGLQNTWSRECGLKQAEHGLHSVFDNKPDDFFTLCGGRPDSTDRSYVSSDDFNADTVIECLGSRSGRAIDCHMNLEVRTWNILASFPRKQLHRWKEIRTDILDFFSKRACEGD